jgi:hypothetical protein
MLLTLQERLDYQERVIRSQEHVIMRLVRERDRSPMSKHDCSRLMTLFDELVKERNELDDLLQISQNTVLSLRLRNQTLEEVCRHFNISYPHVVSNTSSEMVK